MVKFFSKRRLKIAEQIIVVSLFAVLIPMTVSGFIINNINQQSNRAQLRSAAIMIAKIVSEEIDVFTHSINNEITQIIATLEYMNNPEQEQYYLDMIIKKLPFYKELAVVDKSKLEQYKVYSLQDNYYVFNREMANGKYLVAILDLGNLHKNLFRTLTEDKRQIYVLAGENNDLVASSNYSESGYKTSINQLPRKLQNDIPIIYGDTKNQPLVYIKKTSPESIVIVNTSKAVKRSAIDYNRNKIILSIKQS